MKPTESKKKLQINKKTIATLSSADKGSIVGGLQNVDAITTSFGNCTGILCCDPTASSVTVWTVTFTVL